MPLQIRRVAESHCKFAVLNVGGLRRQRYRRVPLAPLFDVSTELSYNIEIRVLKNGTAGGNVPLQVLPL